MLAANCLSQSCTDRITELLAQEIAFIHHESFQKRNATDEILDGACWEDVWAEDVEAVSADGEDTPLAAQVWAVPLLSVEEEGRLFQQLNYLKYRANRLRSSLNPSDPCEASLEELEAILAAVSRVENRIVHANLRLVFSIARRLSSQHYAFDDVVCDGCFSLLKAIEKFDFSRGFRFSTYATHAVQRDIYRKYKKKAREAEKRESNTEFHFHDISEEEDPVVTEAAKLDALNTILVHVDDLLDERERFIIVSRFGLKEQEQPQKLRWIAEELGLSKERVRQLQNRAIEKIQAAVSSQML